MIQLEHIAKSFGGTPVLRDVSLHVAPGESVVVIGGSGTGKSVLLKCILGLETPDSGRVILNGQDAAQGRRAFLDDFGMLFQGAALFDSLPVWQNVAFRLLRTLPRAQARAIAIDKLARVGLEADVADRLPAELSGGMQKRAGLARAIATDPAVLFFDEPTTGLDPVRAHRINMLIKDVLSDTTTAVTITHDLSTVHAIADRVVMLHGGRVHWQGTPETMAQSDDELLTQFMNPAAHTPV